MGNIFSKTASNLWHIQNAVVEGLRRGSKYVAHLTGVENEAINAHQQTKQQLREVTFSDLVPFFEENQLYTLDTYFKNEATEAFNVAGKKITPKLLVDAIHSLPEDKRQAVLLL